MIFFTALAIVAIVDSIGLLLYDLIKNKGKLSRVDKMKMSKRSTIIKGGLDKSENYSMPKVYESGEE